MDYFGREKLRELLERRDGPAVSIYLPTARATNRAEEDRLRFRAALERARELVTTDEGREDADAQDGAPNDGFLDDLDPLTRDVEFWRYQADGLAIFAAPDFRRMYRIPADVPELVVVGPSFHTRPLIEHLQTPDRYWVLGLSQKKVRLWEGTAAGASPVDLVGLPRDLLDALGYEFERDPEFVHRRKAAPRATRGDGGGHTPVFHGHGAAKEETDAELERFFRKVDQGLQRLLKDEIGPLVLAAVEEYHSPYRSISRLDNLADEGIVANVSDWNPDQIHERAWPIAKQEALKKIGEALELWEKSYGRGKGEMDLANLGHLAVAGRVRLLLTERDRRVWGTLDRDSGAIEIVQEGGDDPGNRAVDLLDEIAELVILRGGKSLVLPSDRMPTETGVAGVLR